MEAMQQIILLCGGMGCTCLQEQPLAQYTSFKIGGPAELLIRPSTTAQAAEVLGLAHSLKLPVQIIGRGSNILAPDEGIRGIVLSMDGERAEPLLLENGALRCPAGANLSKLCMEALRHSLTGLEFAWGIPASVGGAVFMNAGAYGGEMADVLERVEYLTPDGRRCEKPVEELELSYRHSWFADHSECLITSAEFRLQPGVQADIRAQMDAHLESRKKKQPLEYPSAGSTFKRPLGNYAGTLIEQCGLKGRRIGGAMVSEKHAGFIINRDCATSEDVKSLIQEVQQQVKRQSGYTLECEVKML